MWFFACRFFTGAGVGGEYAAINSRPKASRQPRSLEHVAEALTAQDGGADDGDIDLR